MKICVYAICKNESKNVVAWVESMREADQIYVLDTGSTDDTVKKLRKLGVIVKQKKIKPWRFDVARNMSLDMVDEDTDLYVCTDLDERFEKGWRQKIEKYYNSKYTRIKYSYNWSFKEDGTVGTFFYLDKIHTKDYYWHHPVHEVLKCTKEEKMLLIKDIVLNHYQDYNKNRSSYLPLLELSVEEDPNDDRNMHYLGREYMYVGEYQKCIDTLHKHLKLPSSTWKDERCASMRYIARCYNKLTYYDEANLWYQKAIDEAPYLREPYVEYAFFNYERQNYQNALELLDKALLITNKSESYINEQYAWDYEVYDLYAICAFYCNKKDIAIAYNKIAISMCPNNERLLKNQEWFTKTA